jgi:uroporphyrin-III C-methyltransferase
VAFITLAQGSENLPSDKTSQPTASPNADTLVYYMGRKDASRIAQQLIEQNCHHGANTPVQILEAVSTARERQWIGNLSQMAAGEADDWFDSSSPALIVIGQALEQKGLKGSSPEIDDCLQNSSALTNSRRRA